MNAWALIPLISAITFAVLFAIVIQQARKEVDRRFVIFLFASAIWSLVTFLMIYNPSVSEAYLKFWNSFVIAAIPLVAVSYYHFVRAYTGKSTNWLVYLGYVFTAIILIAGFTGNVIKKAWMDHGRMFHDIAPWDYIIAAGIVPFIVLTIAMLIRRYRSSKDPSDRNRTMYLIIGWAALVLISYITPFTPDLRTLPTDHIKHPLNTIQWCGSLLDTNVDLVHYVF